MIVFVSSEVAKAQETDHLKSAISNFSEDPLSFAYIDVSKEGGVHKALGGGKAVLYKPKRSKYMNLPVDTVDAFKNSINDALGGGGTWEKGSEL